MTPQILFLAHRAPWPPDRGDRIVSWHVLQALAKLAPVHVAAFADSAGDAAIARPVVEQIAASTCIVPRTRSRAVAAIDALCRGQPLSVGLFADRGMQRHVDALIGGGGISHVFAFSSQVARFVPPTFAGRFVMDFVDVDSAKFEAYAATDRRWSLDGVVHRHEAAALARWEQAVARRADLSLFISEGEAALFRARTGLGSDRVRHLDIGIDTVRYAPGVVPPIVPPVTSIGADAPGPLLVFTGQMDYRPNVEAVCWFATAVLPLIRAARTDARFAIVGRSPAADVRALAGMPGVIVTGEVADTRPWMEQASVVVAPLSVARGVQNKLLEAMAMGCAIVATPPAAAAIDAVQGRDFLVADGAEAMARAVLALIADPAAAQAMGAAARARMLARYGWDATLAPLASMLEFDR